MLLIVLGPFGVIGMFVADLFWAFRIEDLISRDYLRRGWKRVVV